jgi:hypothetical protein
VGIRAIALSLLIVVLASACAAYPNFGASASQKPASSPSIGDAPATPADAIQVQPGQGGVGGYENVTVTGSDATANVSVHSGASVSASVSVNSSVAGDSNVATNSSSISVSSNASALDDQSVVDISVTNGSGTVTRTIRLDGSGRVEIRVTANGDGAPVISVFEEAR